MTVSSSTAKAGPYAGAGSTGPFTVPFRFLDASHLRVIRTSAAGLDTTLALTTDYTVSGVGAASGSVTLTTALATGEKLTVVRSVPFTQDADYVNNDAFPAESHETALDKLTMQTQQLKERVDSALTLPPTSTASGVLPSPEANRVIGWNETATGLTNLDPTVLASIVAFGTARGDVLSGDGSTTVFTLSADPGTLFNLDVSISGVTQTPGIDYTWVSGTTLTFTSAPPAGTNNILVRYIQALPQGQEVTYTQPAAGAVLRPVADAALDVVSAFDFMNDVQIASVRAGNLTSDVTAALQAALDYCTSTTQYGAKCLYLPPGRYRTTSSLLIKKQFAVIRGAGKYATEIYIDGTHSGFNTPSMTYLRPYISDLGIFGGPTSNYGLFFGNVTEQVYLGTIARIIIYTGNTCVYAKGNGSNSNYFSMHMEDVDAYSHNGHSFHIRSGPGNTFVKLYALRAGPGKAGYRMGGLVHLDGCNGLNEGDYWGVFGNDPTATDGFQNDFGGNDYVDLTLTNCNIEEWSSLSSAGSGIVFHNGIRSFVMNGGKFDRSRPGLTALIPQCHSIVRARLGPNNPGNPIELRPSAVFLGATTFSAAPLFADTGAVFTDPISTFRTVGITTFRQSGLDYPLPYKRLTNDKFQNYSFFESSLETRHHTVNVITYKESVIATTGANLNVGVTGFTRIKLTAASTTSVSRFSFAATPGLITEDYARNGELIVEATTANVTLNHNQSGFGKMILAGNATRTLLSGEIARFIWRDSDSAWVEAGSIGSAITNADLGFYVAETPLTIASVAFIANAHYAQRLGGFVTGFGAFDFRAQGSAGADAVWSVQIPFDAGWAAPWSNLAVGLWSAQDGSVHGQITKQIGSTNKLLFACVTTAAVIAATKTCRFQYTYRTFA